MYALFAGYTFYPGGGMNDFVGMFPTIDEAHRVAGQADSYEWYHIVEVRCGRLVQVAGAAADVG